MIAFEKFQLENGLRVLIHEDPSTPMVAVNVIYNVGSRNESPDKTGLAHLMEHLMFSGSKHAPNFDDFIQNASGDNNAFTNNDVTNYYEVLPAENLETALWLEADRMANLTISQEAFDIQKKVVLEEFRETCINQPYGDAWHNISDMAFKVHPYQWPTIGKIPDHVEQTTIEDVRSFYHAYYHPNNAILVVAGNVKKQATFDLINKWFGGLKGAVIPSQRFPKEPPQKKLQQMIRRTNVPVDAVYLAFHSSDRLSDSYYRHDLLSDVLANGRSSRLFRNLLKEKRIFSSVDAYISGSIDPGLFIVEGRPVPGQTLDEAKAHLWEELELLKSAPILDSELQKVKNKVETTLVFSECSILNKAINLGFFELLGNAALINQEAGLYQAVTADELQEEAKAIFSLENCSELMYKAEN